MIEYIENQMMITVAGVFCIFRRHITESVIESAHKKDKLAPIVVSYEQ